MGVTNLRRRKQVDFLPPQSRVADAVVAADWTSSPLGPIEDWPQTLKTALSIVLAAAGPKILVWGPQRITFYNDACLSLVDETTEAVGKAFPPAEHGLWETLRKPVEAALQGEGQVHPNLRGFTLKGDSERTSHFTVCCNSIFEAGAVVGTITDVLETTEQVQLHEILEAENRRFRELFDQAPIFLAVTSGPELRLDYVNAAYERLSGNRKLLGMTVADAFPEFVAQGFIAQLDEAFASGRPLIALDAPVTLLAGPDCAPELDYLDYIFQPILAGEIVTGVLIVGSLVTERRRAEERASELRDQLAHASRMSAMGSVASTLAHELNQPLSAIRNYAAGAQVIAQDQGLAIPELSNALDAMGNNANFATEIIRRLRDMTRRAMVRKEVFELEGAVREAALLARLGPCGKIEITHDFAPGVKVSADRVQIQQVMLNLIRNACESAIESGALTPVRISTVERGKWIEIRVSDQGKGVAPEFMPRLFEAFISTKPDGMGVGLSICRNIVEAQGGRIWAESDDSGTIFCFTIPKV